MNPILGNLSKPIEEKYQRIKVNGSINLTSLWEIRLKIRKYPRQIEGKIGNLDLCMLVLRSMYNPIKTKGKSPPIYKNVQRMYSKILDSPKYTPAPPSITLNFVKL